MLIRTFTQLENLKKFFLQIIVIISIILSVSFYFPADAVPLHAVTKTIHNVNQGDETYDYSLFLPVILSENYGGMVTRRINLPYFEGVDWGGMYSELAVAWFGKVGPIDNYADIRAGYNNEALYVSLNIFDRILWYDLDPSPDDLRNWDSVTLLLDLAANPEKKPGLSSYKFVAAINHWESREEYQASYIGNHYGWEAVSIPFETTTIYRGEGGFNNGGENRGWQVNFKIPFTSLDLSMVPPDGNLWKFGIILHDRDDENGTPIESKTWPEVVDEYDPTSWGELRFGLISFSPPPISISGETVIRNKLDGVIVQDTAIGGTTGNLCPGDSYHIWNVWGNANYSNSPDINIQNQSDVADWPCFAKYYIDFPLESIPAGKIILSARLILYQFGNAGDLSAPDPINRPQLSLIQVLSVADGWDEMTLTWNNAPLAFENISQAWVNPLGEFPEWPGVAREWDVSYGVYKAYAAGRSLNLVMYEADAARHSGKYFSSSDVDDWNEIGRPTLVVSWGEP